MRSEGEKISSQAFQRKNNDTNRERTSFEKLYSFKFEQKTKCLSIHEVTTKDFRAMLIFTVETTGDNLHIKDLLNSYANELTTDMKCAKPGCKKTKIQNRSLQLIDDAPPIIIINFAQYIFDELQDEYKKNSQRINYEYQNQSLSQFVNDTNNLYDLVVVICHLGRHVNIGHFIFYV